MRRMVLGAIAGLLVLCLLLAAVMTLLNRGLPTGSAVVERLSDLDKARLAEATHLRQTIGDQVWPGWGQVDIPLITYNEEYVFLVGYPNPPPGWRKVPSGQAMGGLWEPTPLDAFDGQTYYRQQLPGPGKTPQAFTVRVGDRYVASLPTKDWMTIGLTQQIRKDLPPLVNQVFPYQVFTQMLLGGSDGYISALAHESFHAYVGMTVPDRLAAAETATRQEARYPWGAAGFQAAWQEELNVLAEAATTMSTRQVEESTRRFLALRQVRRAAAGLDPELVDYERQREWSEGLAKYVELLSWREAGLTPGYRPVPGLANDPDFKQYADHKQRWTGQVEQIKRMAGDGDARFYYSGLAQAAVLDSVAPEWKTRIFDPGVWLEDLLQQAVGQP